MADGERTVSRVAVAGGFAAFVLLGALQSVYGPAVPALRDEFGLSAAIAGLIVSGQFAGSMAGILVTTVLRNRLPLGGRLAIAACTVSAGVVGFVVAPHWLVALASSFVIGLGFGAFDVGYSSLFAGSFGRRATTMTNLLHGCFGVGAVLGPVSVALAGGEYRPLLIGGGVLALAIIPFALAAPTERPSAPRRAGQGGRSVHVPMIVAGFALLYFLYAGVESSIGSWEPTHLIELGRSDTEAASLTAFFWASLTAGRLVGAAFGVRFGPALIAKGAVTVATAGVLLAHIDGVAPAAYALAGLGCGPFFPTGIVWLAQRAPADGHGTAFALGAANIGGLALPAGVGVLITVGDATIVPTAAGVMAVATLGLAVVIDRGRALRGVATPVAGRGGSSTG